MKRTINLTALLLLFTGSIFAQGFDVNAEGTQTFSFKDKRNQATFHSNAPLEAINGMSSDINGTVTFNISDLKSTLKGAISIPIESIKTGIDMRDEHLRGEGWLNAAKNKDITFNIKTVSDVKKLEDNKLEAEVKGDFILNGVTKEKTASVTLTYLDENEQTKARAEGDLLGVNTTLNIKLSEYNIKSELIGTKVAEDIQIMVNMVGTNKPKL